MKGKKLLIVAAAALLGVTGIAGCGQKKDDPAVVDVSVTLNKTTLSLETTDTETLVATVTPEGTAVTWSSSDEKVATVDANGKVTAVKAGTCEIIATAGDKEAKCTLTVVTKPKVASISVDIEDINKEMLTQYWDEDQEDYIDDFAELDIEIVTAGKAEHLEEFTVVSSNPNIVSVADVSGKGDWYAFSNGTVGKATITVTSVFDKTVKGELEIKVVEPYVRAASLDTAGIYLVVGNESFGSRTLKGDFDAFGDSKYEPTESFTSSDPTVATVDDEGKVTAVKAGTTVVTYKAGDKTATCTVVVMGEDAKLPANGAKSYVYASAEERLKILGALEEYAVRNKLTGLTLYGNGGYAIYSDTVKKPVEKYVPGFGFGILSSGQITSDLAGETNAAWKRYLHSYLTDDPHSLNYMDDKGSVVGDLIGYVTGAYHGTFLNESKDGYKWVKDLSTANRPIPQNTNPDTGLATIFRIPVRVGEDLKYATNSTAMAKYNNREAELEDYVTPYKIYYTQSYGLARSAENLTGTSSLKGAKAYYDASKNGFSEKAWKDIGIKSGVDGDGNSYLEFEFNNACTPFFAMYYLASGMFAPVPEAFIKELGGGNLAEGVKIWGKSNEDGSLTPVDTFLSTGPYTVERWDADQQIVFKRNPNWDDEEHYDIGGVHLKILTAMKSDPEAALKEFKANRLSSCGIPSTKLSEYVGKDGSILDQRVRQTVGDSNFKLNLNTCDEATWKALFGMDGSITKTSESDYWKLKPAMQNAHFVDGLSFALDRKTYASALGRTPAATYFADTYLSDPENGVSYNSTEEHAKAVENLIGEKAGTDEYGFSKEKAAQAFHQAGVELLAQKAYKAGDTIEIEVAWMESSDEDMFHKPLEAMIEKTFNDACKDLNLKLDLVFWCGQEWSDVYYKKMMVGQFDIGFGSVSGNPYNPLNFLEVLRSDNTSGFTLNWGLDTNAVDGTLVYDNQVWSFDALWQAADQGAYVENGANSALKYSYDEDTFDYEVKDGKLVVTIDVVENNIDDGTITTEFAKLVLYGYDEDQEYVEFDLDKPVRAADQTGVKAGYVRYTVEIALEDYEALQNETSAAIAGMGYAGFDLYFVTTMFGVKGQPAYQKPSIELDEIPGYTPAP